MKKKGFALFTALLVAFQFFIVQPFGGMSLLSSTASASDAISVEDANITVTASEITINGTELTQDTEVKTGDKLKFKFEWEMPENFTYVNGTFYYDFTESLYGITLGTQNITVYDPEGVPTAVYSLNNGILTIRLLKGSSDRSGSCNLEGTIDLTDVETDSDGKFTLKLVDKEFVVIASERIPGLWTTKAAVNAAYYNAEDKLCQDFTIRVGSNNQTSTNVSITDTLGSMYTDVINVKVNGVPTDVTLNNGSFTIDLGNIDAGDANVKEITYSAVIDDSQDIFGNWWTDGSKNIVDASSANDTASSEAHYWLEYPSVVKSGSLNESTGEITWTITVDGKMYKSKDFTVTDTMTGAVTGEWTKTNGDFQLNDDGTYTYTYTTTVPDDVLNTPVDLGISNKAVVQFEDVPTEYVGQAYIGFDGSVKNFIDKTYVKNGNVITWTVNVNVPNIDGITSISINDSLYGDNWSDYCNYIEGNIVDKANSDASKASFRLSDTINEYSLDQLISSGYASVNYGDGNYSIVINNSAYIDTIKGKTLTLSFDTAILDEAALISCSNVATASISTDKGSVTESDKEEYAIPLHADKRTMNNYYYGSEPYPLTWAVYITAGSLALDETITVTDTIPDGLQLIPDMTFLCTDAGDWGHDKSVDGALTVSGTSGEVTFTIRATQTLLDKMAENGTKVLRLSYVTTPTEAERLNLEAAGVDKSYTNSAKITYKGEEITDTFTQTITPNGINKDKYIRKDFKSSYSVLDGDITTYYTSFKIELNKEKKQLNGGNDYTLTDVLGDRLELVEGKIILYNEQWDNVLSSHTYSYDKDNGNVLTLTLKDSTYYLLEYDVKIRYQISDSAVITEEELMEHYGNTATVTLGGDTEISSKATVDESSYRSAGDYVFNQKEHQITISGTKTWLNDGSFAGAPRPNKMVITLVKEKTTPSGGTSTETLTHTFDAPIDDQGNWIYTIKELITKDVDGNTYTYDVSEVAIDGYSVAYSTGTTDLAASDVELDITNTFTAITNEVGKLTVNKEWTGGDALSFRPDVTFTLTDSTGKEYEQVLTAGENSVTFTNLPLYVYGREDDGTLTRTIRTYTLSESTHDGYVSTVSSQPFTLTSDLDVRAPLDTPVVKTVTNNFTADDVEKGSLVVNKSWVDTDETLRADVTITLTDLHTNQTYTQTLNNGADSLTFNDLPLYVYSKGDNGELVRQLRKYSLSENDVDGYTATLPTEFTLVDAVTPNVGLNTPAEQTIINTMDSLANEIGSLKVTKGWLEDTEALRTGITITLTDNTGEINISKELTAGSDTLLFEDLPLFTYTRNGSVIDRTARTYTISETVPEGYTANLPVPFRLTDSTAAGTSLDEPYEVTVTNTFTADDSDELVKVIVNKAWDDAGYEALRPLSVDFTLSASDGSADRTDVLDVLNGDDTAEFLSLPVYTYSRNPDGSLKREAIKYTLAESSADGYTAQLPEAFDLTGGSVNVPVELNITNKFTAEKGSLKVTKTWSDDTDALRPASIVIKLNGGGNEYTQTLTSGNTSVLFTDLPVYTYSRAANGSFVKTAIEYTLTESSVDGYTAQLPEKFALVDAMEQPLEKEIVNEFTLDDNEIGDLVVNKEWVGGSADTRPASITITLTDSNGKIYTETLTSGSTSVTFEDLPLYKYTLDGDTVKRELMKYTLTEGTVTGYTATLPAEFALTDVLTLRTELSVPVEKTITNTADEDDGDDDDEDDDTPGGGGSGGGGIGGGSDDDDPSGDDPSDDDKPSGGDKPSDNDKPTDNDKPSGGNKPSGGGSGGGGGSKPSGGGGGGGSSKPSKPADPKPEVKPAEPDETVETTESEETDETAESEETSETTESEETAETTESEETGEASETEEATETTEPNNPDDKEPVGGGGSSSDPDGTEAPDDSEPTGEAPDEGEKPLDPDDPNNTSQFGDGGTATGANPFTGGSAPAGIFVAIASAFTLSYVISKKRDDDDLSDR